MISPYLEFANLYFIFSFIVDLLNVFLQVICAYLDLKQDHIGVISWKIQRNKLLFLERIHNKYYSANNL